MPTRLLARIPSRYWALVALCGLAVAYMAMFRYDNFGIDEGAAHALLLNWSVVDRIASPIGLLGTPDFRALLFIPLDLHWSGSLIAAKVFTMFLMLALALLLYRWAQERLGAETALIATGLLLLAPATVTQISSVGTGPYLLFSFYLAYWFEQRYRTSKHNVPSDYFLLLLAVAMAISLHPAGLVLPPVLLWYGRTKGMEAKRWRQLTIGLSIAVLTVLAARLGWPDLAWLTNPFVALGDALAGPSLSMAGEHLAYGVFAAGLLVLCATLGWRYLSDDTFGLALSGAIVLGLPAADAGWAMLALTFLLYAGFRLLIEANQRFGWRGFVGQRGLVVVLIVICATLFMSVDKKWRYIASEGLKTPVDRVIARLAEEAADPNTPFLAASQWPARSMLACRREVLPLPRPAADAETLLQQIKGITHIAFDPRAKRNQALARQLALLTAQFETLYLTPAGTILKRR